MKRIAGVMFVVAATFAASGLAQPAQATLRTPAGSRPITIIEQNGVLFVPAETMTAALGGDLTGDAAGYRVTLNGKSAGFTPRSRFGAAGDDLIEMQAPPFLVDERPFVPWTFFRDLLRSTSDQDLRWDAQARRLDVAPFQLDTVEVQVSVVELEETTKIVFQFPQAIEHTIRREPAAFIIDTRNPLQANLQDQSREGELLDRVTVLDRQIVVQLPSADVVGDPYTLDNPFRIVIDLQRGAAPIAPTLPGVRLREPSGVQTIVLDPGHGGKEVGAIGPGGLVEKDATLAICRRLQALIGASLGARVILTRDSDEIVPLDHRTALANQYRADLFLSVHLNASRSSQARGAETYYLSLDASDEAARASAERENRADGAPSPAAVDPTSDLKLILWDLAHQEYLKESSRLAELVQDEMNGASGVANRGVKQAPFRVLIGATMPAALVEIGFISNPAEEARLGSNEYQELVAQALLRAIRRFKQEYEARLGAGEPPARLGRSTPAGASAGPTGR